jgi:hypothetical protein
MPKKTLKAPGPTPEAEIPEKTAETGLEYEDVEPEVQEALINGTLGFEQNNT